MKHRKYASRVIAVSLAGILSAGLCGCRASDAIQKIVYTTDASEVDETELVMNPDLDGELDDQSTEKKADESANQSKQESSAAEGDETNTDKKAETTDPNRKGENDDPDASNESAGKNQNENSQIGVNDGDQDGNTSGDGSKQGNQDEEQGDVYDPEGSQQQIPQVDGYIAAPGGAGLIVQMLGGKGVLCASSGNFLGNRLVQQVFGDEGIADVLNLWDGDGSQPMSDKNFTILMAQKPEAVVTISGQKNFSDAQMKRLESAGVKKITIDLTRAANIVDAVEAVGQLLGDHQVGNTTSVALAAEYVKYENDLRQDVEKQRGYFYTSGDSGPVSDSFYKGHSSISNGCYTFVLWDWDDKFAFKYYGPDGNIYVDQSGGAVTRTGWANTAADYMSVAGVMNTTTRVNESKDIIYWPFYHILGGFDNNVDYKGYDGVMVGGYSERSIDKIDNGLYTATSEILGYEASYEIQNGNYDVTKFGNFIEEGLTKFDSNGNPIKGDFAWIGSERFKYVVAANSEIKDKLESSKNNNMGLYAIRPWGIDVGLPGPFTSGTDLIKQFKNKYGTTFQNYEIEVNPYGCGSWLEGSVESVLESVWMSDLYYDTYDVNKEIKEFYETFYRHSLTGDQISDILDGE